jgi:hypothetical protein
MKEPASYGSHYWCVKIPQSLQEEVEKSEEIQGTLAAPAEIYLYADYCEILPSGALEFRRYKKDKKTGEKISVLNMALAHMEWICVYEADIDDGHAVAVEA